MSSGGVPNQRTVNDRLEALEKGQNKALELLRRLEKKVDQLQKRTFDIKSAHLEVVLYIFTSSVFDVS